jgi:hypothetical protein
MITLFITVLFAIETGSILYYKMYSNKNDVLDDPMGSPFFRTRGRLARGMIFIRIVVIMQRRVVSKNSILDVLDRLGLFCYNELIGESTSR